MTEFDDVVERGKAMLPPLYKWDGSGEFGSGRSFFSFESPKGKKHTVNRECSLYALVENHLRSAIERALRIDMVSDAFTVRGLGGWLNHPQIEELAEMIVIALEVLEL